MARSAGGAHRAQLVHEILLLIVLGLVSALGDPVPPTLATKQQQSHEPSPPHASSIFQFAHPIYNVSIPENSQGKTFASQPPNEERLGIPVTPDLDVKYRIISGDKDNLFKAEERIVGDFAFLGIRTRTRNVILNREKVDEYRLDIRATVSRREGRSKLVSETDTIVVVKVLDTNDLSPLFYPTEYSVTVPEDTPLHQSIVQVVAEDADLGINGEIYYSFMDDTEQFAIHPTRGVITLTRPLKSMERQVYDLVVLAGDRGAGSVSRYSLAKAKVKITVRQVNLHAPEISVQTLPEILESSTSNIYGIVRVTDKDESVHGKICSVDIVGGDPDGHFRIKSTNRSGEYNIEVHRLLDREATPQGYNLTLSAVDCGIPPRLSYKVVPVHLLDTNDNAPVFNREIYEVSVPETSPSNTPVIRLKVTDRDIGKNAQVFLEIVGGNEGGVFRVNPETGMLYTAVPLDAETKPFYTLTVSAIDQGNTGTRKQSSAKVKINVEDTNDNDPIFEQQNMTIYVDENEPAGTTVTKVTARDKDSGENAYISYSIANLNDVPFDIDHFSGVVRTSKLIDYESMRREYILKVRASDWGLPYRRQTEMQLLIKIRDVNDNRPQFERVDCIGNIPRFLTIGTEILTLSAIDFDAGNIISYRLVSGNEDGCFNLDSTSGVISIGCDLNDIGVEQRDINVTATDGTHFADVMTVQVNLINGKGAHRGLNDENGAFECRDTGVARRSAENMANAERNNMPGRDTSNADDFAMMPSRYGENVHAPEFIDFPQEIQLNETVPLGSTVVWIKARDRDLGYNGKLVFGISNGDHDSDFRLDPDTGEIKVIGYLDRERVNEYVLNVTVYDLGRPQKSSSKILPITILDENDNPPKFEKSLASFRVTENAKNGTIIFRLNATDPDLGKNAKITYSLTTDTTDFRIDPETGVLSVSAPLDRERQEVYELKIKATDDGGTNEIPPLYSEALVRVTVDDINDNAPKFSLNDYVVRVREDIPKGTVVAIVTATDLDIGPGGEVQYTLAEAIDDDIVFKIDKLSGTIRTTQSLDYEKRQMYSLVVRAIDRGTPTLSSETLVIVEVIDVNEDRHAPQFDDYVLVGSVSENQQSGAHVMSVVAKDADPPGPDSTITYSVRGGDGLGLFTIDSEGSVRTLATLDLESKPHYWLTICAQDQAVVPLHSCVQVFIQVKNENDNVPLTENPVYYPTVLEGSAAGVEILQLSAEDNDEDPLQRITYRITSGNPEGFFAINSTSGLITTTARKLDRENQPEHILEVMVTDNGLPQLSSTTRVVVEVGDVNDHTPEFDQKFYKVQIPANAKLNQSLFQVLAIDRDIGANGRLTYAIKSGKGKAKFKIHPDTGIIYAAKTFEPEMEYDLIVRAEDNGDPKKSSTARYSILVVAVPESSEHPPVIKTQNQHVEVTENDNAGFLVTLIQAIDEDNDKLWYDIVGGDERNEFYIGRDNGNILLAKKLDWETQNEYNLTVSVSDGVHTAITQLYVTVIDINDHRPEFTESTYKIDISENIDEGTEILQLHATDRDEDKKLFYSLHAARDPISLQLFRVDSVTGSISLVKNLDREMIAEHVLIVIVKDQGTPAKRNYAKVIITVHDHNDHVPEFTSRIVEGKVYETSAIGSSVVQVFAIDRDIGDNARVSYSIVGGNIGNVFHIDPEMGVIRIAKELDISSLSEYMLHVRATDHGKPPLSSQIPVHIMVNMADNAAPKFTQIEPAAEIYENQPIGTFVMHLEARTTSSLLFDIISGNTDDTFFINPTTGVIITKDILDYEKNKFYNLTIRATNMASATATINAIVHVLDRNDNAPYFEQKLYRGEVLESAQIGSLVIAIKDTANNDKSKANATGPLVIKARDADSGLNALLHYDIVELLPRRFFHIDSTTGAIKTVMLLDHEKIPIFNFHVKVSDLGKPKLSSETTAKVQIFINDVNDCAPVFSHKEYNVTLLLPTYENVAVIQVNATDPDTSENSTLRYDIIEGNKDGVFAIDSETGVITTRDVERIGAFYRLNIRVSDGKFTKVSHVNILVETSENSGLIFQKPVYEGAILENTTKITTVVVVNVLGSSLNEHVEFRILNPTDMFKIGLTSGAVETTGIRFDREIRDNYELIVEARSNPPDREKPRVAHVIVNVTILDINDNCPMFVNLPYYAVVSVDDERGSVITKVHAVDLDSYENGEVRYEMKRGHGELFKVDRKSGEVTLKQTLEGHNREYELLIAAYDGGITPCSTDVTVHVKVIDKSMPVFSKQFYSDTVPENIELHSPLSVVIQAESPLGRKLIYTIVKGNELEEFAVDFNTGAIYVVDELDYEQKQNYDLIIRATDGVSGVFAEVPVSVIVQDVNDCPPEIEQDSYNISVSEGSPFGTPIRKIVARDNDTGQNQIITYSIQTDEKNNSSEYFHMDPVEGIIYLKKALDHETLRSHHFTVIATDKGVPSLSSTAHVWVKVVDMNDNPPRFEQPSYSCGLSEQATRGQFVIVVSASDPDYIDHDNLEYTIVEGNELQTYQIDTSTGVITLVNMQNFTAKHTTVLNVSVTDHVYTSYTRVKINLLPANAHNPVFAHLIYDVKVTENQLPGRLVTTVTATDKDFGEYGKITYDIFSDEMKDIFEIDKEKGELTTKLRLDREEKKAYEIPIIATDGGGRSGFTTVKVKVGDENDNPPLFQLREYKSVIHGNLTVNTTFLKIKATDLDDNQNAVVKYSIYDSQNTGVKDLFGINENTGGIYLKQSAEKWENQLFQFFVRAHDAGSPSQHADVPIDIYIMASSENPPIFEKKERILFLTENSPPGAVITRLKLAQNITGKYRIVSDDLDDPQFSINDQGELRLAKSLDREIKDQHLIGILAETDSSPPLTAMAEILLHVQDENDHSPIFESNPYMLTLAENIEKGSSIMKVTARDADSGANGDVRYSLGNDIGEFSNVFDIDSHTGWITTLVPLDKEKRSEYKFQVVGTDNGQAKHSSRTTVFIRLKDYNDCPPVFKNSAYLASVSEDALPGTVVLQISTTDKDIDLNTPIEYYIISGDPFSQFQIRQTGEVYVAKPLDRENIENYELTVIVTDGKFTANTNITIKVLDANDNPPYCLKYRYRETLSEGLHPGSFVLAVQANDIDEPQNARLRFYLTGNGSEEFSLDKETGQLKTARHLDREQQSRFYLTAHVQDRDHPGWECSSQIEIVVLDLNDNAPQFSVDSYSVTLPEDAEVGTLVTKVHATDADIGINRKIKYSFLDSYKEHFKIISDSGIIILNKPLDRESKAVYNLSVQATDEGDPKLSSIAYVIVNVQDINDNPPEFTSRYYFASVPENNAVGSEVLRVLATSRDTGVNAEITYAILSGNEQKKFTINSKTGVLSVADILDYEKSKDFFLTIQAIDGGTPPLTKTASVNISVTDSNDNDPFFMQSSYTARIREDAQIGDKILQVVARDIDSGDNGRISYSIDRGDRLRQFYIEEDTGYISVLAPLDRESISYYVLEVQAHDNGAPFRSTDVLVNIEISDANDNPPLFSESNYTTVVQEDKQIGYTLLKFEINDADATSNATPFTFDFRSGNEGGSFRLEHDGILRTATRFNHKIRDTYKLQIRVFDNGMPPLYSDTWVIVKVIEQSQYPPIITPLEISVNSYQDEFPGGQIGRVFATDQDEYDKLFYNLTPTAGVLYSPTTLFNISKTDGTLYALPRLDAGDYRVNVTVTDGRFSAFMIVKINIEVITSEMLQSAVIIRFRKVKPETFILSYRKGFIRSIRNAMGSKLKDIVIISVQAANDDINYITSRYTRDLYGFTNLSTTHEREKRNANSDLDVLFTVRKPNINSDQVTYFTTDEIRKAIEENQDDIEDTTKLDVDEVVRSKCITNFCINGVCEDKIVINPNIVDPISTDVTSFVSVRHEHLMECNCRDGYGGDNCETVINECAHTPCPSSKVCVPDASIQGFHCACPEGFAGPNCNHDTSKCNDDSCYTPRNPVAFSGKSYAQYRIENEAAKKLFEEQFNLVLRMRTVQLTGNLVFSAGKIDYNILEIVNGVLQYRFDLGSGEGMISVSSIFISDGQWHEVKLDREGNSARIVVDGKHVGSGNAPGVNGVLNVQTNYLYFGGEVRAHPSVLGFEDVQRGFIGCMDDIKVAQHSVPLHMTGGNSYITLKRFTNVEFNCDPLSVLQPLGVCGTQPCYNGGTCKEVGKKSIECVCHSRFVGTYCQEDTDPCASSPCLYGGKCRTEYGNYSCDCPARMTGRRCEFGRFCSPNPCRNGGVCEEGDNGPLCMCRGYTGPTCEIDVNECEKQPCGSGATCINEAGSFRCICPPDLTGASCGDPLYSNSITSKLKTLIDPFILIIALSSIIVFICCIFIMCRCCRNRQSKNLSNVITKNINEPRKDLVLNSVSRDHPEYKRGSKMSNLEVIQRGERPVSYTPSSNAEQNYQCNNMLNNLDTLRSYGSAGDELENVPDVNIYRKQNRTNPIININGHASSDTDSMHKQTWSEQMQLQTFSDNKINNDLKRISPVVPPDPPNRVSTLKSTGILQGRLMNPNLHGGYDDNSVIHGAYHWDCSDWMRNSQTPLSHIQEVPGSEVPDSSSFHSNESNESHPKTTLLPQNFGPVDPIRDIETLNEDIESEFVEDSECDVSEQPLSLNYDPHSSISRLNPLDSGSEDYRFSTAESYLRHPNSYLPRYNIQSETDGESAPLTGKRTNGLDIGPHQIIESDEEDVVQPYGFPSQPNRRNRDIDLALGNGDENNSLLAHHNSHGGASNSDLSTHLCEIDDSEYEQEPQKRVKWSNSIQQTPV